MATAWFIMAMPSCRYEQTANSEVTTRNETPGKSESITSTTRPPAVQEVVSKPTSAPTLIPLPTPVKSVSVAIDSLWERQLAMAVDELNSKDNGWNWILVQEQPDIYITEGDEGYPFASQPIALAVDFISEYDTLTSDDIEGLLLGDSDFITVQPWQDLSPTQRSLSIDGKKPPDIDYPLQQIWSVVHTAGYAEPAELLADALQDRIEDDEIVSVSAVGDIMLDRALGWAIGQGDIEYPFTHVAQTLQQADITIGNLESALGDSGQSANKRYTFQAPVDAAKSLSFAGFDVLSLANNHAMDFGGESLIEGIRLLDDQNIKTVGAGDSNRAARKPVIIEKGKISIAFLAYVDVPIEVSGFDTKTWKATNTEPGLAWAEPEWIKQDVQSALQSAELVIVILHSGYEYTEAPSPVQVTLAKSAIDSGASLVIGHHAHLLQGVEFYGDGVIAYGLGNFAFQMESDPRSAIFTFWLDKDGVREIEIIPVVLYPDGQPMIADALEARLILERIYLLSNLLNN